MRKRSRPVAGTPDIEDVAVRIADLNVGGSVVAALDFVIDEDTALQKVRRQRIELLGRQREMKPGAASDFAITAAHAGLVKRHRQPTRVKLRPAIFLSDELGLESQRVTIKIGTSVDVRNGNLQK